METLPHGSYPEMLRQLAALIEGETDEVSVLANMAAALQEIVQREWVGFYRVKRGQLVLGPFQGGTACYRIGKGRGVCGTAWAQKRTLVVDDVQAFPGYIACSATTRSEVVIPILGKRGAVRAVLDIDSTRLADFQPAEVSFLEAVCELIGKVLYRL